MFSYDYMRTLLMMLDCAVVHSTATWASNSLKGHPFVCNFGSLGLDFLKLKFVLVRVLYEATSGATSGPFKIQWEKSCARTRKIANLP